MQRGLIVGRSAAALDEARAALVLCDYDAVIAVGRVGEVLPGRIDHWVSFHADLFLKWARARADADLPPAGCYWGASYQGRRMYERCPMPDPIRYVATVGGSSGLMAVQVALDELGLDRVVLAGVPMLAGHGQLAEAGGQPGADWDEADKYWRTWLDYAGERELAGRVRSMSGRTRALLGGPDREWLECMG